MLARGAKARGHRVGLLGAPGRFADPDLLAPGSIQVHPLPEPPLDDLMRAARGHRPAEPESATFERALRDDLAAIDALRPDVLVVDNRRSAVVAAEMRGVPSLCLSTAALLGPHCGFVPTLDELADVYAPVLGIPPHAIRATPRWEGLPGQTPVPFQPMMMSPAMVDLASMGGRRREWVHQLSFGDRTAVLDPPTFLPAVGLPAGALQVGPVLPALHPEHPALPPRSTRPRLYLSYGATGATGTFATVLRALLEADVEVVLSTGGLIPTPKHPRVWGGELLDVDRVFPHVDAVICHGGTLTVYHALRHGVPVLAVPGHVEQAITAMALVRSGAGSTLSGMAVALDHGTLVRAAQALLAEPAFRARAQALAAEIDPAASLAACLDAIDSLASA